MVLYIKKSAKVKNLKSVTISIINDVLTCCGEVVIRDGENNQPHDKGGKCHV